ncbi:hypothetical protein [Armatimonas sp.]|uniref:hypothetical protein n=1 Tax=Armatimonas sp. TaxID=1872638 RepID=UPI00286AA04C|nr:hypothetical protein [Armatimonas sp.]
MIWQVHWSGWGFWRRKPGNEARWFGTQTYAITDPPRLLGILDHLFAQCALNAK